MYFILFRFRTHIYSIFTVYGLTIKQSSSKINIISFADRCRIQRIGPFFNFFSHHFRL